MDHTKILQNSQTLSLDAGVIQKDWGKDILEIVQRFYFMTIDKDGKIQIGEIVPVYRLDQNHIGWYPSMDLNFYNFEKDEWDISDPDPEYQFNIGQTQQSYQEAKKLSKRIKKEIGIRTAFVFHCQAQNETTYKDPCDICLDVKCGCMCESGSEADPHSWGCPASERYDEYLSDNSENWYTANSIESINQVARQQSGNKDLDYFFSDMKRANGYVVFIEKTRMITDQFIKRSTTWEMPNKRSFKLRIFEYIFNKYCDIIHDIWIDPSANESSIANITNDLNPAFNTDYHEDKNIFLKRFTTGELKHIEVYGVLLDLPFSSRQIKECYDGFGLKPNQLTTSGNFYSEPKKLINEIEPVMVITVSWNSNGINHKQYPKKYRTVEEISIRHGGWHNDTRFIIQVIGEDDPLEIMRKIHFN